MTQQTICKLNDIIPDAGVCALVKTAQGDQQVAVFRTKDDKLFAIDNFDPFSEANVLSRGLIGGTTIKKDGQEDQEVIYVASPIYKQRFNLATGQCLDDKTVKLNAYQVSLVGDTVMIEIKTAIEEEMVA